MKRIRSLFLLYFTQVIFYSPTSFAAKSVWSKEIEQANENVSIIFGFFSKNFLINIIFAFCVLIWTFFFSKILTAKITSYLEITSEWKWSNKEELIWVLTRTVNISVLTIWVFITLGILWVDIWFLMWWIWFWLGFTLKVFLSNFMAWILMVTQWYYHNWDLIKIWDKTGKIKNINALFTSVKQFDGIIFYIPNIKFIEENVSNYNSNDKRRVEIDVPVDYDTDLLKAKEVMFKLLDNFPNILKAPKPNIFVTEFWNSSINLGLKFWISTSDNYFQIKSNVTETVNLALKKHNIIIPFPQVTLSKRKWFELNLEE